MQRVNLILSLVLFAYSFPLSGASDFLKHKTLKKLISYYLKQINPKENHTALQIQAPNTKIQKTIASYSKVLNNDPKIIVSFTTIAARINQIQPVIDSILRQTLPPDSIELYISDHPSIFPGGLDTGIPRKNIPLFLHDYEKKGKIQTFYTENIGPANKLIPCLKKNWGTDNIIITIDDDTIYPPYVVEQLVSAYLRERCIIAHRTLYMTFKNKKKKLKHLKSMHKWLWPPHDQRTTDLYHFTTGKDGVLYTPRFFTEEVFKRDFLQLCPKDDDVWFNFMRLKNNIPVYPIYKDFDYFPILSYAQDKISLSHANIGHSKSNKHVQNVVHALGL